MHINAFYKAWGTAKAYAILAFIILSFLIIIRSYCFDLEMDYRGPGSEAESLNRDTEQKEGREAAERVNEDEREGRESNERTVEMACDYWGQNAS